MNIPQKAIDEAYAAMFAANGVDVDDPDIPINVAAAYLYADMAQAALEAALPCLEAALRKQIAAEQGASAANALLGFI